MFSVFYFLERYLFTRQGVATTSALALALWGSQYIDTGSSGGQASNSTDGLVASSLVIMLLFGCLVSALVGAFIDGRRGALWGLFLGPIGWVIASIRRLEGRAPTEPTIDMSEENETGHREIPEGMPLAYDLKKWDILKDVDPDIKAASDRVSAFDPRLEAILADQYLCLSDKTYLEPLVDKLLSSAIRKDTIGSQMSAEPVPGLYEVPGLFRIRILPDGSVAVLSSPSGELSAYERFADLEKFLTANSAAGVNKGLLRSLD